MGLSQNERRKINDILENVDPNTDPHVLTTLAVKLMALQVQLMSDMANELSGIERCLERMAGRM